MRKLICIVVSLVLLLSFPIQAFAYGANDIMPMYENISTVYAAISVDESLGITTCTGRITAKSTSYPVSVDVILQMYKDNRWTTLASWSASDTWSVTCMKHYAVYSGYQYRVLVYGYVYDDAGRIIESGSAVHSVNYPKK